MGWKHRRGLDQSRKQRRLRPAVAATRTSDWRRSPRAAFATSRGEADVRHLAEIAACAAPLRKLGGERRRPAGIMQRDRAGAKGRGSPPAASARALRRHRPRRPPAQIAPASARFESRLAVAARRGRGLSRRPGTASFSASASLPASGAGGAASRQPRRFRRARRSGADDVQRLGPIDGRVGWKGLGAGRDDRVVARAFRREGERDDRHDRQARDAESRAGAGARALPAASSRARNSATRCLAASEVRHGRPLSAGGPGRQARLADPARRALPVTPSQASLPRDPCWTKPSTRRTSPPHGAGASSTSGRTSTDCARSRCSAWSPSTPIARCFRAASPASTCSSSFPAF